MSDIEERDERVALLLRPHTAMVVAEAAGRYLEAAAAVLGYDDKIVENQVLVSKQQAALYMADPQSCGYSTEELRSKARVFEKYARSTAGEAKRMPLIMKILSFISGGHEQVGRPPVTGPMEPGEVMAVTTTVALALTALKLASGA